MSVYISDQVYFAYGLEQFLDIPIHFVNIPPITPKYPLPPGLMFGNIFSGWTYTALIATKVIEIIDDGYTKMLSFISTQQPKCSFVLKYC